MEALVDGSNDEGNMVNPSAEDMEIFHLSAGMKTIIKKRDA